MYFILNKQGGDTVFQQWMKRRIKGIIDEKYNDGLGETSLEKIGYERNFAKMGYA